MSYFLQSSSMVSSEAFIRLAIYFLPNLFFYIFPEQLPIQIVDRDCFQPLSKESYILQPLNKELVDIGDPLICTRCSSFKRPRILQRCSRRRGFVRA